MCHPCSARTMFNFNRYQWITKLPLKPRQATDSELFYLSIWAINNQFGLTRYTDAHYEAIKKQISQSAIAVFDTYPTGKLMNVVWGKSKQHFMLFEFGEDGFVRFVKQAPKTKDLSAK